MLILVAIAASALDRRASAASDINICLASAASDIDIRLLIQYFKSWDRQVVNEHSLKLARNWVHYLRELGADNILVRVLKITAAKLSSLVL